VVREDDLRATFDALHAKGVPARPFSAADVIREGNRQRRAHRMWAVGGTGVLTAAAVAALVFFIPGKPEPVLPADPPTVTVTPSTTPAEPSSSTPPQPPTSSPAGDTSGSTSGSPSSTTPGSMPQTTVPDPPTSVPATT
jgi:hypothetical protein